MSAKKIVIGKATFKESITKQEKQKLIKAQSEQILNSNIWKLQYKSYVMQGWSHVMEQIESASCQRIDLHNNQFPQILKSLAFPCFTNIVTLVLQKNQIDNVEALTFLNMETLNFLDLDDNCVTNLKPFDKLKWPLLRKLQVRNNFIQKFQFSRMKTKHRLQKVYLDEMFDKNIMTQDISMLIKLQTDQIDNLQIEAKNRIIQPTILQILSKKYSKIEISYWALFESDQQDEQDDQDDQDDQDEDDQDEDDELLIFEPVTPV